MVFGSVVFLFRFLPVFLVLYFITYLWPSAGRMRNVILFLGSLLFYAWGEPTGVLLLLCSTVLHYIYGRLIGHFRESVFAGGLLVLSIVMDLTILLGFKFGVGDLLLPIGISFYTFRAMSYTIDVYRGKVKAQRKLLDFGIYVTMFPTIIAGPIVRYREVQEQLKDRPFQPEGISYGFRRFCVGLAKKALLADQLALLWQEISRQGELSVLSAWLGIVAFALRIYFDFSGYSDMAIGLGAILGFKLPENFRYPYLSASVTEFWRRWHVTLGRWFRDYVYIPLGGNRKGVLRQLVNLLIVWVLIGILHGVGWNFLLWGLWIALFLILEKVIPDRMMKNLPGVIGWLYTTLVVLIGWVFFALEDMSSLGRYLSALFGIGADGLYNAPGLYCLRENAVLLILAVAAATPVGSRMAAGLQKNGSSLGMVIRRFCEKLVLAALLLLSIAYIANSPGALFPYFRF